MKPRPKPRPLFPRISPPARRHSTFVFAALTLLGTGAAAPVRAQQSAPAPSPAAAPTAATASVTLDLKNVPVRDALEQLFKTTGANYQIAPDITGLVTLNVKNVPFSNALRLVLRGAEPPLTYNVENGIYIVRPRRAVVDSAPSPDPTPSAAVSLSTDGDVRAALKTLFGQAGVSYVLGKNVAGAVTLEFKNLPFSDALRIVLGAADLSCTVENGVYVVAPRQNRTGPDQSVAAMNALASAVSAGLSSLAAAVTPAPVPLTGLSVQQLQNRALAQEVQLATLRKTYGPNHPQSLDARNRLQAIREVLARYQKTNSPAAAAAVRSGRAAARGSTPRRGALAANG